MLTISIIICEPDLQKTRHNDAFLEIQIFASMNSINLKLCSIVISMPEEGRRVHVSHRFCTDRALQGVVGLNNIPIDSLSQA